MIIYCCIYDDDGVVIFYMAQVTCTQIYYEFFMEEIEAFDNKEKVRHYTQRVSHGNVPYFLRILADCPLSRRTRVHVMLHNIMHTAVLPKMTIALYIKEK